MKKIGIPMFHEDLRVYRSEEREDFQRYIWSLLGDGYYGCHGANAIWIGKHSCTTLEQIVVHELTHYVDWLYKEALACGDNMDATSELRAYTIAWLFPRVMKVVKEEI